MGAAMAHFKFARQRRRTMCRGRRRREEERRRQRTEGYELEQGIYRRKQREEGVSGAGRRRRRRSVLQRTTCGEKICSAGVTLFRAQRHSASGYKCPSAWGVGKE